jgi:hypothetical protein
LLGFLAQRREQVPTVKLKSMAGGAPAILGYPNIPVHKHSNKARKRNRGASPSARFARWSSLNLSITSPAAIIANTALTAVQNNSGPAEAQTWPAGSDTSPMTIDNDMSVFRANVTSLSRFVGFPIRRSG